MIVSETMIPVDNVRLATGARGRISRSIVTFPTMEVETVSINGY
jgi:hypothetical protein